MKTTCTYKSTTWELENLPEYRRQELEAHLLTCEECALWVRSIQELRSTSTVNPTVEESNQIITGVMRAIRKTPPVHQNWWETAMVFNGFRYSLGALSILLMTLFITEHRLEREMKLTASRGDVILKSKWTDPRLKKSTRRSTINWKQLWQSRNLSINTHSK